MPASRSTQPEPESRRTPLPLKLLAVVTALVVVPGGAFLVAANIGTGGMVAFGAAVVWWVLASAILGRTLLRRRGDLRTPVRAALALAAVASVVTLFVITRDEEVDEQIATGAPAAPAEERAPGAPRQGSARRESQPRGNVQVLAGRFDGASGHSGSGRAAVVELAEGGRVLTFSDFDVDMGAGELRVYLTAGEPESDGDVTDFEDLAKLKGNVGDQQYELPAGVDLERFSTVVIWCVPFSTRIAQARLS